MASIKIKQHDIKDCGAACLASIGNHYKVNLPLAESVSMPILINEVLMC
jgi:ABC-type bacteriocin/lantibiotic exporter with double-glycine peptidase domain